MISFYNLIARNSYKLKKMWGTRHSLISFICVFHFHGSKSWRSITLRARSGVAQVEISILILNYYKPLMLFLLIGLITLSEYIFIFFDEEETI